MSILTREQVDELFERSKDDHAIIVGSEVRELCGTISELRAMNKRQTDFAARTLERAEKAETALRIAELKNKGTLANNLCPDHRDKQVGKPCLACTIEKAESDLAAARVNEARYRMGLAAAITWALEERGGYDDLTEKYFRWATPVVEAIAGDPEIADVIDAAIEAEARREFIEEARSGHITGSAHSIRYGEKRVALLERIDAALADEKVPAYSVIYEFDRYRNGTLMAEDIRITTARSLDEAWRLARGKLCDPGDVLKLRATVHVPIDAALAAPEATTEPVAWMADVAPDGYNDCSCLKTEADKWLRMGIKVVPLYAHPVSAEAVEPCEFYDDDE